MVEKTLDEVYWEKISNARTYEWDSIEFNITGNYGFMSVGNATEKLDQALISFAAGYEDGLSFYLNQNGRCDGAHILGDLLGLDVNYIKCAEAWFNQCRLLCSGEENNGTQADAEEVEETKKQYLQQARVYLDAAQKKGQPECEFGEAEYLLACGKRKEARAAFMKIYQENKNFSYESRHMIDTMYSEDHPECMIERKKTIFEKWGDNITLQFILYFFAVAVSWLFFPLTIALVALNLYANHKSKEYWREQKSKAHCPDIDLDRPCVDSVFTSIKNPVSPELFKLGFVADRPEEPCYSGCTKKVKHTEEYRDANGRYRTRTYTTEEPDYDKMEYLKRQYKYDMVQWHNGVMEKVRLCRIENWKRLKTRVEQGDSNAKLLMEVMGFDTEHHNNGVAKLPARINSIYEGFTFNTIAAWAPYEEINPNK